MTDFRKRVRAAAPFALALALAGIACGPDGDTASVAPAAPDPAPAPELPPLPGPLTADDVSLDRALEVLERLADRGLIPAHYLDAVRSDPENFLAVMRDVISDPEKFGIDVEALEEREASLARSLRRNHQ